MPLSVDHARDTLRVLPYPLTKREDEVSVPANWDDYEASISSYGDTLPLLLGGMMHLVVGKVFTQGGDDFENYVRLRAYLASQPIEPNGERLDEYLLAAWNRIAVKILAEVTEKLRPPEKIFWASEVVLNPLHTSVQVLKHLLQDDQLTQACIAGTIQNKSSDGTLSRITSVAELVQTVITTDDSFFVSGAPVIDSRLRRDDKPIPLTEIQTLTLVEKVGLLQRVALGYYNFGYNFSDQTSLGARRRYMEELNPRVGFVGARADIIGVFATAQASSQAKAIAREFPNFAKGSLAEFLRADTEKLHKLQQLCAYIITGELQFAVVELKTSPYGAGAESQAKLEDQPSRAHVLDAAHTVFSLWQLLVTLSSARVNGQTTSVDLRQTMHPDADVRASITQKIGALCRQLFRSKTASSRVFIVNIAAPMLTQRVEGGRAKYVVSPMVNSAHFSHKVHSLSPAHLFTVLTAKVGWFLGMLQTTDSTQTE